MGALIEAACNYDETALLNDGSCLYTELGYNCDDDVLQVGGFAHGGIIFYIDETGHGLVATMQEFEPMNWDDAMAAAESYTSQGYFDWYMPSLDELNLMYNTIGNGGPNGNMGNFAETDYLYWSSTPHSNPFYYYGVYFDDEGNSNYIGENNLLRVRPIRSF